jgi:hypothetical protein
LYRCGVDLHRARAPRSRIRGGPLPTKGPAGLGVAGASTAHESAVHREES